MIVRFGWPGKKTGPAWPSPTLHGTDHSLVSYPPDRILEALRATAGVEATTQLAAARVDERGGVAQLRRRPSPIQRPPSPPPSRQ
jgi:hypothetical protein